MLPSVTDRKSLRETVCSSSLTLTHFLESHRPGEFMFITLEVTLSPQGDALQSGCFICFISCGLICFPSEVASCNRTKISLKPAVTSCPFPGSSTHMDSSRNLQCLKLWASFTFPYEQVRVHMDVSPPLLKEIRL